MRRLTAPVWLVDLAACFVFTRPALLPEDPPLIRAQVPGTEWAIVLAGMPTVVQMSPMNLALHSDFRWVVMLPAML